MRNRSPFAEMAEFKDAVEELITVMKQESMVNVPVGSFERAEAALASAKTWLLGELFPANQCLPYNAVVEKK